MILNTYSVVLLFTSTVVGGVAVLIFFLILRLLSAGPYIADEDSQQKGFLLLHIAQVILVVEALLWPLFYMTLQSYVPYIQGAMCIFGVTEAQRGLSAIVQIYKLSLFFLIGWWLLLDRVDSSAETMPLFRRKILALLIISIFVFIDSVVTVYYLLRFDIEVDVACCTTVFDLAERKTTVISESVLGSNYQGSLYSLYFMSNFALIGMYIVSYLRAGKKGFWIISTSAVVMALLNALITVTAYFEIISPVVMDLPGHHCVYCMWKYQPISAVFTFLLGIGTFAAGWSFLIYLTTRKKDIDEIVFKYIRRVSLLGGICIAGSLVLQYAVT